MHPSTEGGLRGNVYQKPVKDLVVKQRCVTTTEEREMRPSIPQPLCVRPCSAPPCPGLPCLTPSLPSPCPALPDQSSNLTKRQVVKGCARLAYLGSYILTGVRIPLSSLIYSIRGLNPLSTGTHFYLEFMGGMRQFYLH
ncbi:hypothetical protein E2C01_091595 [Portunus trituberculatus]|uniref:Uncharacterized protein n=1 Tax=Portunus trituberculatus TaxID=210409 RepID=A0A5B7JNC5_PORTR|nr:hypothetical protein [Portunus trituberculatus]